MTIERRFVEEKIRELDAKEYLKKDLEAAGYSDTLIKRTPMGTHVIIRAMRPGMVIGSAGENVDKLTKKLTSLKLDNPHIEVQNVEQPDLDAKVVAWRIGKLMERGFYFKSVALRTIESVMRAGARGVEIRITGKVPSARARRWCFKTGYIQHCGETVKEEVLTSNYTAMLRSGMLGIKVRIMPPNIIFPDEVIIREVPVPSTTTVADVTAAKPEAEAKGSIEKPKQERPKKQSQKKKEEAPAETKQQEEKKE